MIKTIKHQKYGGISFPLLKPASSSGRSHHGSAVTTRLTRQGTSHRVVGDGAGVVSPS